MMKRQVSSGISMNSRLPDKYSLAETLSQTSATIVKRGYLKNSEQTEVAIKRMKIEQDDQVLPPHILRELAIINELNYIHIARPPINCITYEQEDSRISYAYEFGTTDLRKVINFYIQRKTPMPESTYKSVLFQILLALDYMHKRGISHCNVTPNNMIIMPTTSITPGILKLIDFSHARVNDCQRRIRPVNLIAQAYRAPEILLGDSEFGSSSDLWAAGAIFAEMVGIPIFPKAQELQETAGQFNANLVYKLFENFNPFSPEEFTKHDTYQFFPTFQQFCMQANTHSNRRQSFNQKISSLNQEAQDLMMRLLTVNPETRISAHDALRHRYFNQKPYPTLNISRTFSPDEWKSLSASAKME